MYRCSKMGFKISIFIILLTSPIVFSYYNSNNNYYTLPYNPQSVLQPSYSYSVPIKPPSPVAPQCARLWDGYEFNGRSMELIENDRRSNLESYYFMPKAVKIRSGCSLTLFDSYGLKHVVEKDEQYLWMVGNSMKYARQLSASCCECDHCEGQAVMRDLQCARLYEYERCNGCTGFRLDLKDGDKVKTFGHLDNRMSSLAIRPGCNLITYYKPNYEGWRYNFTRSVNLLGENWNKQISSAECSCPGETWNPWPPGGTQPSIPSTTRSNVLPTIPSIVIPITRPTPSTSATPPTALPTWYTEPITRPTMPTWAPPTSTPTTTLPEDGSYEDEWGLSPEKSTPEPDSWLDSDEEEETTTQQKLTTTTKATTTTTTEESTPWEDSDEDNNDSDDDWGNGKSSEEEESVTTTTTTTQRTTTTEEPDGDNEWDMESSEEEDATTTTKKTTTTTTEESVPSEESDEEPWGFGGDISSEEKPEETFVVITTTTTTTTTTPRPITKASTTTTTEQPEKSEEEEAGFWGDDDEW